MKVIQSTTRRALQQATRRLLAIMLLAPTVADTASDPFLRDRPDAAFDALDLACVELLDATHLGGPISAKHAPRPADTVGR